MQEDYAALYGELHQRNGGKYFPGRSRGQDADDMMAALIREFVPDRVLDYGSGKGSQYTGDNPAHKRWGLAKPPVCYDVGVPTLRRRPDGVFGGILCTDMMEHIAESDVPLILTDIASFAGPRAFIYFHISTRASGNRRKNLADGRDPHLTVQPPDWWRGHLAKIERPGLRIAAHFEG